MMFSVLQILAVVMVAVAMALSLAHALELPGKLRQAQEAYYAVQPIYYPGFTIGGGSEPVGTVLLTILGKFHKMPKVANTFSTQRVKGSKGQRSLKLETFDPLTL